jgi:hypothetical protein
MTHTHWSPCRRFFDTAFPTSCRAAIRSAGSADAPALKPTSGIMMAAAERLVSGRRGRGKIQAKAGRGGADHRPGPISPRPVVGRGLGVRAKTEWSCPTPEAGKTGSAPERGGAWLHGECRPLGAPLSGEGTGTAGSSRLGRLFRGARRQAGPALGEQARQRRVARQPAQAGSECRLHPHPRFSRRLRDGPGIGAGPVPVA